MTGPSGQAVMNQELYRLLFTESSPNGGTADLGGGRGARQGGG
jgi:hypothetical protein